MTNTPDNPTAAITLVLTADTPKPQRLAALFGLVDDYQPEYFDPLLSLLTNDNEDTEIRSAVAMCFGKLINQYVDQSVLDERTTRVMEALQHLAQTEPNEVVRGYVITALGMSGRKDAITTIVAALKDPDLKVFHNAAEALGRFDRAAVPHLIEQLTVGADDAKCIAAWKLGEMGYGEAIPPLLKLLENPNSSDEVAALAIWALGEIGTEAPGVSAALKIALEHPAPEIHERARLAIKKIARNWN